MIAQSLAPSHARAAPTAEVCEPKVNAAHDLFEQGRYEAAAQQYGALAAAGPCGGDEPLDLAGYAFQAWGRAAVQGAEPALILKAETSILALVDQFQEGEKNPLLDEQENQKIFEGTTELAQEIRDSETAPPQPPEEEIHPTPPKWELIVLGTSAGLAAATLAAGLSLHGTRVQSAALYTEIWSYYSMLETKHDQRDMCGQTNRAANATLNTLCGEHEVRGVAANVLLVTAGVSATMAIVSGVLFARNKNRKTYAGRLNLAAAPRLEGGATLHVGLRF